MAKDLVLITGVTGFIGFRVLLYTLEAGYQVRAAVRSEVKAQNITANPALQALKRESQISFIIVPNFLAPGAFDEAIKGVKFVIHVASPIPFQEPPDKDYERFFVQPAVQGTLEVFESAKKAGGVKRIVVTSSVVALTGREGLAGHQSTLTAEDRPPLEKGPFEDSPHAYAVSKVAALIRAEEWIEKTKPDFDVVHLHPSFVLGRNDLYENTKDFASGTNIIPLAVATGNASPAQTFAFGFTHVTDTARAHVLSLDAKKDKKWDDIFAILEKRYPEALEKGIFKKGEVWGTGDFSADVRKTEKTFGFKLAGLEEAVTPVLDQFLELFAKEQK